MDVFLNKNNIVLENKEGIEQQEFLFSMPLVNSTFLPKGIHLEDIDKGFLHYIKNELNVIVNDKKVEAVLLSMQKFAEYIQTWDITDERTKTPSLPIITVVRKPIAKQGTSFDKVTFNIPYESQYTLYRIPKTINGKNTYEYYQIPQPINVDLEYEVSFFATRQRDINKLNEIMLKEYKSSQRYINVDGHHMGTYLTAIEDDSKTEISQRRFYNSKYNILTKGYILEENDFKVVKFYDDVKIKPDFYDSQRNCIITDIIQIDSCNSCIKFKIPRKSKIFEKEYKIPYNILINSHNKAFLDGIQIFINNVLVDIPFQINKGDILKVVISPDVVLKKELVLSFCGTHF